MTRRAAQILREARQRSGMTQAQLASGAGVTQSVISAYEKGHREPSLPTLTRLVRATGLELELSLSAPHGSRLRDLVAEHRVALLRSLQARGARNIRLFGSAARGDDRSDSDVDLLIDLAPDIGLFALAGMAADAERILGVPVDVVPADSLKPSVAESALADAVAV